LVFFYNNEDSVARMKLGREDNNIILSMSWCQCRGEMAPKINVGAKT
jgi:hypothetical protein